MRSSQYLLSTLRETPKDIKMISYKLMIKSGMIRKLSSGLYIWLPTGLRVLNKIKKLIKKEIEKIGFTEIIMPIIQPSSLWEESGRISQYNQELFRFFDRNNKPFLLGPTHEEMITNFIQKEIHSYKNLPLHFYQIQTKFRDEIRPRFGVIRSKEFVMKDAYSFHIDQKSLQKTYDKVYDTYCTIFNSMELKFQVTQTDSGFIGGKISHEFQALSKNNYSSSLSKKRNLIFFRNSLEEIKLQKNNIELELLNLCKYSKENHFLVKKVIEYFLIENSFKFSLQDLITRKIYQEEDFLKILIFLCKKNVQLTHNIWNFLNLHNRTDINKEKKFEMNWDEYFYLSEILSSKKEKIKISLKGRKNFLPEKKENIEIGHIFQIGTKYSKIKKFIIKNKNNSKCLIVMGCYGIGVTRTIAAIVEQNHDKEGILWPHQLSPFDVSILPIDMYKFKDVRDTAEDIYFKLKNNAIDVLFDDRKEYFGVMLSDTFLIGIPHILIISKKNLKHGKVEYKNRKENINSLISKEKILDFLLEKINS